MKSALEYYYNFSAIEMQLLLIVIIFGFSW